MRQSYIHRKLKSSSAPAYHFDGDTEAERVIRDPMSVLLGRSSLTLQQDGRNTDPYNRIGRLAHRQ